MTETSVYIANNSEDIKVAEDWLGTELDAIQLVGGYQNWSDWSNSPMWIAQQVEGVAPKALWSIGLIPWGANLKDAGEGAYNDKYVELARNMAAMYPDEESIHVRVGWEFNFGELFPWSATGQEENYVAAFRQFVDAFRSVSDKFVFEWTPNTGDRGVDLAAAYPGDDYVDVIGVDFYYDKKWDPADPYEAWYWYVNQPYGLQWQQDFAAQHGKPTAIGEWGINMDTAGPFIELAAQWFEDHDVLYQNYWNSNAAFEGSLSNGQYPEAAAVFQSIYGRGENPYADDTTPVNRDGRDGVDLMIGHAGDDTLSGNGGDDWLHGGAGNDVLNGGAGNDVLDGGTGVDVMKGGSGDDVYYVDHVDDRVIELQGKAQGDDHIFASVSYDLARQFVETLTLTGAADIDAFGNSQANTLNGNAGNNILDGRGGADLMQGGAGDDTYYVDDPGDRVIELENEGFDQVFSSVSFDLAGTSVEKLTMIGSADINATGNEHANTLVGNDGDNRLSGRGGDDTLTGNAGADTFVISGSGRTTITDFEIGDVLDLSEFLGVGARSAPLDQQAQDDGLLLNVGDHTSVMLLGVPIDTPWTVSDGLFHIG